MRGRYIDSFIAFVQMAYMDSGEVIDIDNGADGDENSEGSIPSTGILETSEKSTWDDLWKMGGGVILLLSLPVVLFALQKSKKIPPSRLRGNYRGEMKSER
ncbi:MAG: hypothetical protein ACTSRK_00860 [Promethearchaeota archaeon]